MEASRHRQTHRLKKVVAIIATAGAFSTVWRTMPPVTIGIQQQSLDAELSLEAPDGDPLESKPGGGAPPNYRPLPDPVVLPLPPSGDGTNHPYFVRVTTRRKKQTKMTTTTTTTTTTIPITSPRSSNDTHSPRMSTTTDVVVDSEAHSYDKEHRGYYLVATNYPWSVVLPNPGTENENESRRKQQNTSFSPSQDFLERTSVQASDYRCDIVATNGGPFDEGGIWNSGPTVRNGVLVRTKPGANATNFVGFGTATERRTSTDGDGDGDSGSEKRYWILGTYGQLLEALPAATPQATAVWDFVTGFGWLVYHGRPVSRDSDPTGAVRAPRTAIGLDGDSNLLVLVVDGCEHCLRRKGPTLEELADLMVDLGAVYAINMDGGGSSTMAMPFPLPARFGSNGSNNGTVASDPDQSNRKHGYAVINRPTCLDVPFPHCQRKVATVLCVSSDGAI